METDGEDKEEGEGREGAQDGKSKLKTTKK